MDVKTNPRTGEQEVFSITFDKLNGERVFIPRAVLLRSEHGHDSKPLQGSTSR